MWWGRTEHREEQHQDAAFERHDKHSLLDSKNSATNKNNRQGYSPRSRHRFDPGNAPRWCEARLNRSHDKNSTEAAQMTTNNKNNEEMAEPTKKGPPSSHTRSWVATPGPVQEHTGQAPQHRAARPNAPSTSGRGAGGAKAPNVRSPIRTGRIRKGVPIDASRDTPLPVTEIVHANPHTAGESNISNNTGKSSRPS